jgi:hypothetical protein
MRRRAERGTFHLPNSGGPSGRAALVTMPMPDMKEAANVTRGSKCQSPPLIRLSKMSGMQWHRLSCSNAAGATGAQNLSCAVQAVRRQGTDNRGRQLRRPYFTRHQLVRRVLSARAIAAKLLASVR